jgi:hypothetical protein
MIALLLALAPVAGHTVYGTLTDIPEETFRTNRMAEHLECGSFVTDTKCWQLARTWNQCTGAERIRETGQPLECETAIEPDAYCIWHSDGTVEAKNATCSGRKGERQ